MLSQVSQWLHSYVATVGISVPSTNVRGEITMPNVALSQMDKSQVEYLCAHSNES